MKFKYITILLILMCFFISLSNISASDNLNPENISSIDDETNLKVSNIDDLDKRIQNSTPDSIIKLEKDVYVSNDTQCQGINIYNNITIDGQGHKIDGNAAEMDFLFKIYSDDVVLKNIVFSNWDLIYSYNTIEWTANNGQMRNCTFINNTAHYGGAVDWTGINGMLINCTFINNVAENGGAVYWYGIYGNIAECTFINNTATLGGATYISGRDTKLDNSKFIDNSASDKGGAVYADGLIFYCQNPIL